MRDWFEDAFDRNVALGCLVAILVFALALGIVFGVLCFEGWILMLLWNAILVPLFGFGTLKFWWAVGILLICNLLFKGTTTITKNKGE
jgi:ABC-type transport system involved in cytochrome c biogenesis permease component